MAGNLLWLWLACAGAGALALCGVLLLGTRLDRAGRRRLTDLLAADVPRRLPRFRLVEEVAALGWTHTPATTRLLLAGAAAAGALAGVSSLGSALGAVPGAGLALWTLRAYARRRAAAQRQAVRERLPDVLLGMAGCLRSGQSLAQAVEAVADAAGDPLEVALAGALDDYRAGTPLLQALGKVQERFPEDLTYFTQALEIHRLSGGNLAEVLAGGALALTEQRALQGELEARTAEARLSARILLALPVALALYFWWTNRAMLSPLWETTAGRIGAGYAVFSWLAGKTLMQRLIDAIKA